MPSALSLKELIKMSLALFFFSFVAIRIYNPFPVLMFQSDTDDGSYFAWTEGTLKNHSFDWCRGVSNRNLIEGCGIPDSPKAHPYNKYAPGQPLMLLPWTTLGHILTKVGLDFGPEPLVFWTNVGTFFLALLGLLLLYDFSAYWLKDGTQAFWLTVFFMGGNEVLHYVFRRPFLPHAGEFFLFMLATWLSITRNVTENPRPRTVFAIGLVAALLVVTRMTSFYAVPFFFVAPFYGTVFSQKGLDRVKVVAAYAMGAAIPVGFFLFTNYLQTGAWIYRPEQYDAEFSLLGLFLGHPRNWIRILHFFLSPHWGAFLLMPFLLVETAILIGFARPLWHWTKSNRTLVLGLVGCLLVHLINMANFPMNGASYGLRYVLTSYYCLHITFIFAVSQFGLPTRTKNLLKPVGIACIVIATLNGLNFESNQSTLTLTWGQLWQEGTVDPKWANSRQLVAPHFALHSLKNTATLKSVQNLGATPLVAYPLHFFKNSLRSIGPLSKAYEYYESPKRDIHQWSDLKYLFRYHLTLFTILIFIFALLLIRPQRRTHA